MGFNTLKACSMVTLNMVVNKDQLEINTNILHFFPYFLFQAFITVFNHAPSTDMYQIQQVWTSAGLPCTKAA